MKIYLHYVQNCSPSLKVFKTLQARDKFIKKFETNNDSWIEFSIVGTLINIYDAHYASQLSNKRKTKSTKVK